MRIILSWITIVVLVVALQAQRNATAAANEAAVRIDEDRTLARLAERWLGHPVPASVRSLLPTELEPRLRLLWIVNPERCEGCFYAPATWNQLAASGQIPQYVVIAGGDGATLDPAVLHARTHVTRTRRDLLAEDFGGEFRSLRLVVDRRGRIVSVDSRATNRTCTWHFEAEVARLAGLQVDIGFYREVSAATRLMASPGAPGAREGGGPSPDVALLQLGG